jgi:hypothetical protein
MHEMANSPIQDISMPVMDGLVSTSKIRKYEKEKTTSGHPASWQ